MMISRAHPEPGSRHCEAAVDSVLRTCSENVVGRASRLPWGVPPLHFRGRDARSSQAGGPRHYFQRRSQEISRCVTAAATVHKPNVRQN